MLKLMGGGNIIKCKISRHVKRRAQTKARILLRERPALFFLRADDKHGRALAVICPLALGVTAERERQRIARTARKSRGYYRQGLHPEVSFRKFAKLLVFPVKTNKIG